MVYNQTFVSELSREHLNQSLFHSLSPLTTPCHPLPGGDSDMPLLKRGIKFLKSKFGNAPQVVKTPYAPLWLENNLIISPVPLTPTLLDAWAVLYSSKEYHLQI